MRNVHSWRREAEQCFHSEHLDLLSCLTECFCSQIKTFCQSDAVRKLTTTLFSCLFCFFWNIFFSQHFIYFPFLTANMATKAKPTLNQHTGGAAGLWMEGQKVQKKLQTKITTLISCVIVWELSQIQLLIQAGRLEAEPASAAAPLLEFDWRKKKRAIYVNLLQTLKWRD